MNNNTLSDEWKSTTPVQKNHHHNHHNDEDNVDDDNLPTDYLLDAYFALVEFGLHQDLLHHLSYASLVHYAQSAEPYRTEAMLERLDALAPYNMSSTPPQPPCTVKVERLTDEMFFGTFALPIKHMADILARYNVHVDDAFPAFVKTHTRPRGTFLV
jgi:hypothetical protein